MQKEAGANPQADGFFVVEPAGPATPDDTEMDLETRLTDAGLHLAAASEIEDPEARTRATSAMRARLSTRSNRSPTEAGLAATPDDSNMSPFHASTPTGDPDGGL